MSDTPDAASAHHRHQLGPFDTDDDPAEEDAAIVALASAVYAQCETCRRTRTPAVADDLPTLMRLIELLGRAHKGPHRTVRDLGVCFEQMAYFVEARPFDRETALGRLGPEGRTVTAATAVKLLTGAWWLRQMAAEAAARAAAEAQRATARYGLIGPPADAEPSWAWALLHTESTHDLLCVVPSLNPADKRYLLGPVTLDRAEERREAALVLRTEGWVPVWGWRDWEEVDLASMGQGGVVGPGGRAREGSERRWILRIRRPAIEAATDPVPYANALHSRLDCDCFYDADDPFAAWPPPGRVREAVCVLIAGDRPASDIASAQQTIAGHRVWLRDQIRKHGWPRPGGDQHDTARLVLAWVATDPDAKAKRSSIAKLREAVDAGLADPAYITVLASGVELPLIGLVDRPHAGCRSPLPRPAGGAAAA